MYVCVYDNMKCWQGCRATGTLNILLVGMENSIATPENSLAVSYKHNISYDLEILLLAIYPRKMETCSHKSLYMNVYSKTLFIIAIN